MPRYLVVDTALEAFLGSCPRLEEALVDRCCFRFEFPPESGRVPLLLLRSPWYLRNMVVEYVVRTALLNTHADPTIKDGVPPNLSNIIM